MWKLKCYSITYNDWWWDWSEWFMVFAESRKEAKLMWWGIPYIRDWCADWREYISSCWYYYKIRRERKKEVPEWAKKGEVPSGYYDKHGWTIE